VKRRKESKGKRKSTWEGDDHESNASNAIDHQCYRHCGSPGFAEKLIDSVRLHVTPVSRDVVLISRDVKSIVQSIHRQVDRVEDGIETVHDMAVRVKEFQWEVKRRIEEPLLQLAAVVGGVKRGVEAISSIFC